LVLLGANYSVPGSLVAAAGVLANLDVVLLNQGMPVVAQTASRALSAVSRSGGFYHLATGSSLSAWAGDVLPLRVLGETQILSVGDLLLIIGVAALIASSMLEPSDIAETSQATP